MSAEFPGSDDQWPDGPANRLEQASGLPGASGASGASGPHGDTIAFGPPPGGGRSRRPLVVAGVAVVALICGASVAYAASGSKLVSTTAASAAPSATPSPLPSHPGFRHFGGFGGPFGPGSGFGLGLGGVLGAVHGQLVVPKSGGGYQTIDIQSGQVTAVSSSSITLKSADGFIHSYAVTATTLVDAERDGIGSVKVGNQASVLATVSGSAATAVSVTDTTLLRNGHQGSWSGQGSYGSPGGQNS
jgi:hypothetical protein